MVSHFKAFKLTYSILFFFTFIAIMQGAFNYRQDIKKQVVITASSQRPSPAQGPDGILTGQGIWHTDSKYPQWVLFKFEKPTNITLFKMLSQGDSPSGLEHKRAPKVFIIQGSNNGINWENLLEVKDAIYEYGSQWKEWVFRNKDYYIYYRIYITANNGDPDLITIQQIKIGKAGKIQYLSHFISNIVKRARAK